MSDSKGSGRQDAGLPEGADPLGPLPSPEVRELTTLLREGRFKEFREEVGDGRPDLRNAELRLADLRGAPIGRADLRGAYLRRADLRGLDLIDADLDGASMHSAQISGVRFPRNLPAAEIDLSLRYGTRMRTLTGPAPDETSEPLAHQPLTGAPGSGDAEPQGATDAGETETPE